MGLIAAASVILLSLAGHAQAVTCPSGSAFELRRPSDNIPLACVTGSGGDGRFSVSSATFNGVPYQWPPTQGAASTRLSNDGSGNLSWVSAGGGGDAVLAGTQTFSGANTFTGATTVSTITFTQSIHHSSAAFSCASESFAVTANVISRAVAWSTVTINNVHAGSDLEVTYAGTMSNSNSGSQSRISFLHNGAFPSPLSASSYIIAQISDQSMNFSFSWIVKNVSAGSHTFALAPGADGSITVYVPRQTFPGCAQFSVKELR